MNSSILRYSVFFDGSYFLHISNYYNFQHPLHKRLTIPGLLRFVRHQVALHEDRYLNECHLVNAHYFRNRFSAADANAHVNLLYNDRILDDILMSTGVLAHYMPLRMRNGRKEEKGIDVLLALETYEEAITRHLDVVVLITADSDYIPLIRKLHSLGVRTFVLNWAFQFVDDNGKEMVTRISRDLTQEATYPIIVSDVIEKGIVANDPETMCLFTTSDSDNGDLPTMEMREIREIPRQDPVEEDPETSELIYRAPIINLKKNYGFIEFPPHNMFFYHKDLLNVAYEELEEGDIVEFTIGLNEKGSEIAKKIRKI